MTSSANATQVGGTHYKADYQHWDFVWDCHMGYFPGQITKYLCRWRTKNGLQDLNKALHFAKKYLELIPFEQVTLDTSCYLVKFVMSHPGMGGLEVLVTSLICTSHNANAVGRCVAAIEVLIAQSEPVAGAATSNYVDQ